MVGPQAQRQAVQVLITERQLGVTRACGLAGISRSLYGYRSRRPACAGLRERIAEIAAQKRRFGYRRVYTRLRREGWAVNKKRVYRLYREAGLAVRRRKRKRIGPVERHPLPKPVAPNVSWSMDFRRYVGSPMWTSDSSKSAAPTVANLPGAKLASIGANLSSPVESAAELSLENQSTSFFKDMTDECLGTGCIVGDTSDWEDL